MEIPKGNFETLKRMAPGLQVNLGDATLLSSLRAVSQGRRVAIIDNNRRSADKIIHELEHGIPVFSFLSASDAERKVYASIDAKVLQDPDRAKLMREVYVGVWEEAKNKLGLLTFVESDIKDAGTYLRDPLFLADQVTYYYPSPVFDPQFPVLELAGLVLKPNGTLTVVSENHEVISNFNDLAGPFVTWSGFEIRGQDEYLSAYDIAWGEDGHYRTVVQNTDGRLAEYIAAVKSGLAFRVMSFLGIVR